MNRRTLSAARSAVECGVTLILLLLSPCLATGQIISAFPLHAVQPDVGDCDIGDPCESRPNTFVIPFNAAAVYLSTRNIGPIAGVQTAFAWEPGTWQIIFGEWNCQENQLVIREPTGPGPTDGTLTTTFDCMTQSFSPIIGILHMMPISGCLWQVNSSFEHGTHVLSCEMDVWEIEPEFSGSICVEDWGIDACYPEAIEPSTWGGIKTQYRDAE